jgi:hypothetical protein
MGLQRPHASIAQSRIGLRVHSQRVNDTTRGVDELTLTSR